MSCKCNIVKSSCTAAISLICSSRDEKVANISESSLHRGRQRDREQTGREKAKVQLKRRRNSYREKLQRN